MAAGRTPTPATPFAVDDSVKSRWWTDRAGGPTSRNHMWFPAVVTAVDDANGTVDLMYTDDWREAVRPRS